MKHTVKATIIILSMFLIAQFIGLYVVDSYSTQKVIDGKIIKMEAKTLPYGMGVPELNEEDYSNSLSSIIISFILAIIIIFALTHIKAKRIMKTWFFLVTILAMGISFTAFLPNVLYAPWIALAIAIPLAINKVYRQEPLSHNFSELFIYPGIAAVFVPLINVIGIIILLIIISVYDMWAVWKSKIMQKMAKYQMDELKVFGGFFIPYANKKQKIKIKKMREKIKKKEISKEEAQKKGIKVNVAVLGGGDIVFPIIASGVILKTWGIWPAIGVVFGALIGLASLLLFSKKKKFYPAMPFITSGIFLAMLLSWIIL